MHVIYTKAFITFVFSRLSLYMLFVTYHKVYHSWYTLFCILCPVLTFHFSQTLWSIVLLQSCSMYNFTKTCNYKILEPSVIGWCILAMSWKSIFVCGGGQWIMGIKFRTSAFQTATAPLSYSPGLAGALSEIFWLELPWIHQNIIKLILLPWFLIS